MVQVDVPESLPAVAGAQSDLEQLLLNLLSNARDAMPDGGRVTIRAAGEGSNLKISVEDSGRGIAPEILPRIAEPFFTNKPTCSCLGLSICRAIVWDMHGDLRFDSTPGRGTLATVLLPISGIV